jgi:hypothetical protein
MYFANARGTQRRVPALSVLFLAVFGIAFGVAVATAAPPEAPTTTVTDDAGIAIAPPLTRTAPEQALRAILDEGRTQVEALLAQAQADPARVESLQQEICRVKAETNVRFLQKQVELASASGDAARLIEAQQALENAVNPPAPVAAVTSVGGQGVVK